MPEQITFLASFPPIQSAIKIGQDGMRIQLDIPESEMGNAVELLAMRNVALMVTVTQFDKQMRANGESKLAARRERKSTRTTAEIESTD